MYWNIPLGHDKTLITRLDNIYLSGGRSPLL